MSVHVNYFIDQEAEAKRHADRFDPAFFTGVYAVAFEAKDRHRDVVVTLYRYRDAVEGRGVWRASSYAVAGGGVDVRKCRPLGKSDQRAFGVWSALAEKFGFTITMSVDGKVVPWREGMGGYALTLELGSGVIL